MKRTVTCFLAIMGLYALPMNAGRDPEVFESGSRITFTENKGQVSDQFYHARPDVLFSGNAGSMTYHLKKDGISYQLKRVDSWRNANTDPFNLQKENKQIPDQITIYRLDIAWMNMNKQFTVATDEVLPGHENFYLEACPNGVKNVRTYSGITYKNIYKNTDLHYYQKDGSLKYDFIVAPGADYKKIQLKIEGANKISLQADGSVILKTPLGNISEGAPIVYQNGKQLSATWKIDNNNLSFDIKNYNPALPMIIDPAVRIWGTYYSGGPVAYEAESPFCTLNTSGEVFMAGTNANAVGTNIATIGSHQSTAGGYVDAYLVKFDNAGIRQWATYYGGAQDDRARGCTADASGNIYMCGMSESTVAISTAGAHQVTKDLASDAYLVKFDPTGARIWGTYYGGDGSFESGYGCSIDATGNVIMNGFTNSTNAISTTGAHQELHGGGFSDIFIVKFTSAGVRQWGTYYGGTDTDVTYKKCVSDASGNLYLSGWSNSPTSTLVASVGSHQTSFGGGVNGDAILVKFNSAGVRQWGTYYGGTGADIGFGCAIDNSGNVYLSGYSETFGGTSIATPGSHQPAHSGTSDREGFLAKFNSSGTRLWATYYGGPGTEHNGTCETDAAGHVYLAGATSSTISISTSGAHQTVYAGNNNDGYLVEFDAAGVRQWGTYYGGPYSDDISDFRIDQYGTIYAAGYTTPSLSGIATTGSHQDTPLGTSGQSSYLIRLNNNCITPATPSDITPVANKSICTGNNATLTVNGTGWLSWYSTSTSTTSIGSGSTLVTPSLTSGTYTYYVEAYTCTTSITRTEITVTVSTNTVPVISVASGSICEGGSFTIIPSGADTYTFSGGSAIVSPTINTSYSVTGTSTSGCVSATMAVLTVTVHERPTVSVNSGTLCSEKTFTLEPSGASSYVISGGSTYVSPMITTQYSVTGTSSVGCASSNTALATVSVVTSPVVSLNTGSICSGQSFSIIPSGVDTYTFLSGASSVTPGITTSYSVIGTGTNSCPSTNTAVTTITVSPSPTITVNSGDICMGQVFTITPSGIDPGGTYVIAPGSTVQVSPLTTTSYSVSGTSSAGCVSTNTALSAVTVYSLPVVSAANGIACTGRTFTIAASGADTYSINGTASTNLTLSPSATNDYSITGTSINNCVSSNTAVITISVSTTPTVSVNSGSICSGKSFTILPSASPSGFVNFVITGGTFTVSPVADTDYSITATNPEGCVSDLAIASISVSASPTLSVNSGSICSGLIFTMTPGGASTYSIDGTASTIFTFNPTADTDYTVTGTSLEGCLSTNTVVSSVTILSLPLVSVNSGTICEGLTFTLIPTGAQSFSLNGIATSIFTVNPVLPATDYSITGTDALGCVSISNAVSSVSVITLPIVSVNSGSICAGEVFTMNPSGAATYSLNGTLITNFTVNPSATTSYTLTGSNTSGCISQNATSAVTVHTLPTLSVSSGSLCLGQSFILTPGGAATYTISGGTATVNPSVTTMYTIAGSSSVGCVASSTVSATVSVIALPTITVTGNQNAICAGETVTLQASGANSYAWSTGDNTASTSINPLTTGEYTVVGMATSGCTHTLMALQVVNECTGIGQITSSSADIVIYPNPNAGQFNVIISGISQPLRMEIYNAIGQKLQDHTLNNTASSFNIAMYANGIYFVRIFENNTFLKQEKIIKQ